MSETLTPRHDEISQEAERLRQSHGHWSEALEQAESINNNAQELREQIERSDNPEEEFSYQDRVFANGEIGQREMLSGAKLHYNANMWEAREHYQQHRDEYYDLARLAMEEAGVEMSSVDIDTQTGEKIDRKPATMVNVRRHSEYDGGFPENGWGKATEDERETLGHLTEEGVQNAHRVARELVEQRLEETEGNIDFLVISSPTYWLGDEQLGQRAIETARIYSDEILEALKGSDMPESHLLNTQHSKRSQHQIGNVRKNNKIVEAQMFDDPDMISAIDELREKYGGQGTEFWDAWYEGVDNEALDQVGAERSTDAAERIDKLIETLIRYGNLHNKATGRNLEIIVITHHEVLQPYALHELGISQEEFVPGKNEGFELISDGEKTTVTVAGHEVERISRRERREEQAKQK